MINPEIIKEWFLKADEDYEFASLSLEYEMSFYSPICFHFHQAVEKYLKAYIVANDLEFKKIHDLIKLLNICKESNPSFREIEEDAKLFSGFYIEPRYPHHWPTHYTLKNAKELQQAAKTIGDFVKNQLKKEKGKKRNGK